MKNVRSIPLLILLLLSPKNTGSGSAEDYLYANGLILASVNGTSTSYYHEDALGSVRLVTSSSGATQFSSDYKPYGTVYGSWGAAVFMYTSKPIDPATGLYYSSARFYDPAAARFMTEDGVTGNLNAPLTLNRYVYADDNPMTLVDPTGHFIEEGGDFFQVKKSSSGKGMVLAGPTGTTVVTSSVMAVPPAPPVPPPSTPSVTPSNVAPQQSTNTPASPPSNSAVQEMIEQGTANAASSQPAATTTTSVSSSTVTVTETYTQTTIQSSSSSTTNVVNHAGDAVL
jgi:RHS repeat-associated protein